LGKIHFLRRFLPNYTEIIKEITRMLKKDEEEKWAEEAHESLSMIKRAFEEAHVFISLDHLKPFLFLSFAYPYIVDVALWQKNNEGHELPIVFFS